MQNVQPCNDMKELLDLLKKRGRGDLAENLDRILKCQQSNRSLGAMFGAMIGDGLGSYCQFQPSISPQVLQKAMMMEGGGTFGPNMKPGQYTDDTELAFHLLSGLNTFDENLPLSQQKYIILQNIGGEFWKWILGKPFDIGNTCRAAIKCISKHQKYFHPYQAKKQITKEKFDVVKDQIYACNQNMQSNGSLMRITPMAVFMGMTGINIRQNIQFIKDQICLSHPNINLRSAGASYVQLLSQLIQRKSNSIQELKNIYLRIEKQNEYKNIQEWFQQAKNTRQNSMPGVPKMGWAKIGWSYSFKVLFSIINGSEMIDNPNLFKSWIKWTIGRAGDTDTNAAIVGGLIGSIIGFNRLPIEYLKKIFALEFQKQSNVRTNRAKQYEPVNFLQVSLKFIGKCQHFKQSNAQKLGNVKLQQQHCEYMNKQKNQIQANKSKSISAYNEAKSETVKNYQNTNGH